MDDGHTFFESDMNERKERSMPPNLLQAIYEEVVATRKQINLLTKEQAGQAESIRQLKRRQDRCDPVQKVDLAANENRQDRYLERILSFASILIALATLWYLHAKVNLMEKQTDALLDRNNMSIEQPEDHSE